MASIRFADRATASLRRQLAYRRARNPQSAANLSADIHHAERLLSEHPLAGRRVAGTRVTRVALTRRYRYRLLYRVDGDEVLILDILHPSRGP